MIEKQKGTNSTLRAEIHSLTDKLDAKSTEFNKIVKTNNPKKESIYFMQKTDRIIMEMQNLRKMFNIRIK